MRGPTRIIAVIALLFALSTSSFAVPRKVIYVDYQPINWVDPSVTTNALVDMGYNVINLAFWMYDNPADFVGVWSSAAASARQNAINHAHSKGAIIMVACGGGTETPFDRSATDYGTKIGQFAANNLLDGIDFDLENFGQGFLAPGKTAQATIDWIVTANNAARAAFAAIRGTQPVISHAPQGPYFGKVGDSTSWVGPLGGYTAVEKNTQVDFYNVQFYNQGATCYTTYESLFVRSAADCSVFPGTSISEINQWGVPMSKIILGKPLLAGDASNGFNTGAALKTMISHAQSNGINWNAGVMFWMFHGADQASALTMLQTLYTSTSSSSSSSSSSSGTSSTSTSSSGSGTSTTGKASTSTSTSTSTSGKATTTTTTTTGKASTSTSGSTSTSTSGKASTSGSTSTSTSGSSSSGSANNGNCLTGTTQCNSAPESAANYQCCSAGATCFNSGSTGVCCGPSTVGCVYGAAGSKKSACCDSRYATCDSSRGCVSK